MELQIQDLYDYVSFIKSQNNGLFVVGGTGHRLGDKLGGYSPDIQNKLNNLNREFLIKINPSQIISGMAIGWDLALAEMGLNLNIPLIAAIPFKGQELQWPIQSKNKYLEILNNPITTPYFICSEGYEGWKMQRRNEWMADRVNLILAFWDGNKKGGTYNCIEYCKRKNIPWVNLYPFFNEEKIIIGNLKNLSPKLGYIDVICDRNTALGNPYELTKESDRELCVKVFSVWLEINLKFYENIKFRNKYLDPHLLLEELGWDGKVSNTWKNFTVDEVTSAFVNLLRLIREDKKIRLLCHCDPELCHTSMIKRKLVEIIINL